MKHLIALMNSITQTASKCKRIALIIKKREESTSNAAYCYTMLLNSLAAANMTPGAGHNLKDAGLLYQIEAKGPRVENLL